MTLQAQKHTVASASFSECGRYRYTLDRSWGDGDFLTFVMLNPSTANAYNDDPTIRRCIGFAHRNGAKGIKVVNAFALRATNPRDLITADDPHGPDNWAILCAALNSGHQIVCAWGANSLTRAFAHKFISAAEIRANSLWCLGKTRDGSPRHPLYVRGDQPLEIYP